MPNGNCLFSSAFLSLVGDNSLVHQLRAMAAVELYVNATYYVQHPALKSVYEKSYNKVFSSYRTVFELAHGLRDTKTSDLNYSYEALVQNEAMTICKNRVLASFLCVLSLSSVFGRFIQLYYPDSGMYKYKALFNQLAAPRTEPLSGKPIIILWSNLAGSLTHKMDDFVALISRKSNKGMKKRKLDKLIPSHQLLSKVLRNKKRLTSLCLLNHQKNITLRL